MLHSGFSMGSGRREAIPVGGSTGSGFLASLDPVRHNDYRAHHDKSPTKPVIKNIHPLSASIRPPATSLNLKTPSLGSVFWSPSSSRLKTPSPASVFSSANRSHLKTPSRASVVWSTDSDHGTSVCQPNLVKIMEPPLQIGDLRRQKTLELQEKYEGDLKFKKVSLQDLEKWKRENLERDEEDEIRYEYNFFSQCLTIKCMPMPTHDSLQNYFVQNAFGSLVERVGLSRANKLVKVGSGTSFRGFPGDWSRSTEKQPDAYIMSKKKGTKFPSVVCEAGWAETEDELLEDARLWLLYTEGETKIVIIIAFAEIENKDAGETGGETVGGSGTGRKRNAETMMIDTIDESTDYDELVETLIRLNKESSLQKRLVNDVSAILHVYRTTKDKKDVTEVFGETLLPPPSAESEAPNKFEIELKDVLGDEVPDDRDATECIIFSLPELREFVEETLPHTELIRAHRRAEKLMRDAGVWEERETFAQYKRRRRGPGRASA